VCFVSTKYDGKRTHRDNHAGADDRRRHLHAGTDIVLFRHIRVHLDHEG
jgi:hypothetical protein